MTEQSLVTARNRVPVVPDAAPAASLDGPSGPIAVHARGKRFAEGPVADSQEGLRWVIGDGIARRHRGRGEEGKEVGVGFDGSDDVEERGGRKWQRPGGAQGTALVVIAIGIVLSVVGEEVWDIDERAPLWSSDRCYRYL